MISPEAVALLAAEAGVAPSSLAGIITATGTVLTAVGLLITAMGAYRRSKLVEHKVDAVHVIVNQSRTDMLRYQRALVKALKAAGVEVPEDQSVEGDDA